VDVFSGTAFIWAEAVCAVLRRAARPYILTLHGGNLPHFASRFPRRVRWLLHSAAAVTAPSHYLRRSLETVKHNIELLPNAVDVAQYHFRFREKLRPRLMWMRAFHEVYNPLVAIRALALLVKDYPDMQLRMAGPDKGDGSLQSARALAIALGVGPNIYFDGPVPKREVPRWLAQGDIFLNTPRIDNTPVTVLEVMACGLCAISTDVGGIRDLVDDRTTALLTASDDAAGIASAVRELLSDPSLAGRLSSRGRRKVENLDWPVVLDEWESLLFRATGRFLGRPKMTAKSAAV